MVRFLVNLSVLFGNGLAVSIRSEDVSMSSDTSSFEKPIFKLCPSCSQEHNEAIGLHESWQVILHNKISLPNFKNRILKCKCSLFTVMLVV